MNEQKLLDDIDSCLDCKSCLEVCDTFKATNNELQSPNGRLKIAKKVFSSENVSEDERFSLYTCTLCSACNLECPQAINIANIVHASKIKLVENNQGPFEIHEKIIKGIVENDNSVGGKSEERLDWLPEEYKANETFEKKDSDTLLFLGCMSSFRVKESASAPYKILTHAGYNFKILENEPCCGEYVYSAGKLELAKETFRNNMELFKKNGIRNLIVTCGGCLYAFDIVYPKYIEDYDIKVKHIIDVVHELVQSGKLILKKIDKTVTYHDPCRLGRKYKSGPLIDEPRELLEKCGIEVKNITENPREGPCCGAGSGIRGVDSNLVIKIGADLFNKIETKEIATSCPLCVFNFRYVNYKSQMDKESKYITDYILESIEKK